MTKGDATWDRVVEALAKGRVAGAHPGPFERYETHGAVILASEEAVYKLKKPVVLKVFDYGSAGRRREFCQAEAELNRRLAPDLYLGTRAVVEDANGLRLVGGDVDDAVEWLLAMRYIARRRSLMWQVDMARANADDLRRVGRKVAAFHLAADPVGLPAGSVRAVSAWLEGRLQALRDLGDELFDPDRIGLLAQFLRRWLDRKGSLLEERAAAGWVRDGHGDLRLEHIIVDPDEVAVIDCVEFDRSLRTTDVLADLAFAAMELELAQRRDLTVALIEGWQERCASFDASVFWFFATGKALVRAEVAGDRVAQLAPGYERTVAIDGARSHFALAERLSWRARRPLAVVIGGLSGSGKSIVSAKLAQRSGVERVSSDEVRKKLVGVRRDELAPEHAYTDYISDLVYERLGYAAGEALAEDRPIVVDATFRRDSDRRRFARAFEEVGGAWNRLVYLELSVPDDVLRARVREREEAGGSDADIAVLEEQLALPRAEDGGAFPAAIEVDASAPIDVVCARIEEGVLAYI